jgi:primosomal protein N' (replication factor Y)
MTEHKTVIQVAVPAPLRKAFDYLLPERLGHQAVAGARVRVPFGRRELLGVIVGLAGDSDVDPWRLKPIRELIDTEAVLPESLMALLRWVASYYHHPIGEVLQTALPVLLRRGQAAIAVGEKKWVLTDEGRQTEPADLGRAPLQRRLLQALAASDRALGGQTLKEISKGWRTAMRQLQDKGWVVSRHEDCLASPLQNIQSAPELTPAQASAVAAVTNNGKGFAPYLLYGVTGSGKTEVYFQLVQQVLDAGKQALVLVPEIGLTPQLVDRFRRRFSSPIAVLHSGLSDSERLCAWVSARDHRAGIVLGTRSAVFSPFANLGLIIVDEEHDGSFKQQDGLRYHARDVAVMRASREGVPIVLGSATPALESLRLAKEGKYSLLELPERAQDAQLPEVKLLDMQRLAINDGLSHPLVQAIRDRIGRKEQSLLFLNRRGFSPVLMCYDCGWIAPCQRCDARMTLHKRSNRLCCHHCGAERALPERCPECESENLHPLGEGTERVEQALERLFSDARILRIDRDTTRRKGELEEKLDSVRRGEVDILVGTQMLAKGHDFPNITLVGILNADQGIYGSDFRAPETMLQRILQVSGRAGRADLHGEVLIQTWHPGHPVFRALKSHDYTTFAEQELAQRQAAHYPPYCHFALLRAEATAPGEALNFLKKAQSLGRAIAPAGVELLSAVPSPMERRAGRYRAQLLVQSDERKPLHGFLDQWLDAIEQEKQSKRVRWSLDVDPMDMY